MGGRHRQFGRLKIGSRTRRSVMLLSRRKNIGNREPAVWTVEFHFVRVTPVAHWET
jgi:hypothetical protein